MLFDILFTLLSKFNLFY